MPYFMRPHIRLSTYRRSVTDVTWYLVLASSQVPFETRLRNGLCPFLPGGFSTAIKELINLELIDVSINICRNYVRMLVCLIRSI